MLFPFGVDVPSQSKNERGVACRSENLKKHTSLSSPWKLAPFYPKRKRAAPARGRCGETTAGCVRSVAVELPYDVLSLVAA
jgi:hypothetical protein